MSLLSELIAAEGPEIDRSERYRLIPTLGTRNRSWFAYGLEAAREDAQRSFAETGVPVLVCRFPPQGLTEALFTVGKVERKGRIR